MTGHSPRAVLFDKDGTLFDFRATWDTWIGGVLADLAQGNELLHQRLAQAVRYDLKTRQLQPDSLIIAGTNRQAAQCLVDHLPNWVLADLETFLTQAAIRAPLTEAVPLVPLLAELEARGMPLGVMTNDSEFAARSHLRTVGIEGVFDFIAGFDSGFGAKPAPGPLLAFADAIHHRPETVVMVGDSLHDLSAGRAAGMWTVGVLTGTATRADLAPLADVVLPDIGHLPAWVDARNMR